MKNKPKQSNEELQNKEDLRRTDEYFHWLQEYNRTVAAKPFGMTLEQRLKSQAFEQGNMKAYGALKFLKSF